VSHLTIVVMLLFVPAWGWSAELCSGQYNNAREMAQAALQKYDSLYSGGNHWHRIDDLGATLDLYRLWRSLPDWRLRKLGHSGLDYDIYSEGTFREVEQLQWVAEQVSDTDLKPEQKFDAIVGLDLAGVIITPPDALLDYSASYSPQWMWLQLVMTASDAPWAIAPHLAQANDPRMLAYGRLKDKAWERYEESGGIEWAVAAQTLVPTGVADTQADRLFLRWQTDVRRCRASQGEYAAWAVTAPFRWTSREMSADSISSLKPLFEQLPIASQHLAIRNLSWATLLESLQLHPPFYPPSDTAPRLAAIAKLANSSPDNIASWVNVARTYHASSLEELIEVHQHHKVEAKSARAFNLLSATDMARLSEAPGLSSDMRKALVMTAFARHVALGNVEQAQDLIPLLQQLIPEYASDIDTRLRQNLPQQIRLDLIVLDIPELSVWLVAADENYGDAGIELRNSRPRRDLPRELASTLAIEQDLQTWLLLPQKRDRFRGMHGYTLNALDRNYASVARTTPEAIAAPVLFKTTPSSADRYLEHWVAWNELPRLVQGNGLSRAISRDIVEWANSESDNWLKRLFLDQELMAQALSQVVQLNRREDGGMLGQLPSGQAAFTLLHSRFPDSEAAKQTPYWYR